MIDKKIIIRRKWKCSTCGKNINLRLDSCQRMKDGRILCLDCWIKDWETRARKNLLGGQDNVN